QVLLVCSTLSYVSLVGKVYVAVLPFVEMRLLQRLRPHRHHNLVRDTDVNDEPRLLQNQKRHRVRSRYEHSRNSLQRYFFLLSRYANSHAGSNRCILSLVAASFFFLFCVLPSLRCLLQSCSLLVTTILRCFCILAAQHSFSF
ncbi:transmembrane protein, putative, partial [Bodo saltans]